MSERSKRFVDFKFGERFKELLKNATKEDRENLAEHLNTTTSAFRQWTNGYALPTCENLSKLAEFFNVSTDWLLGLSDNPNYDDRGVTAEGLGLSPRAAFVLRVHYDLFRHTPMAEKSFTLLGTINSLIEQEMTASFYSQLPDSDLEEHLKPQANDTPIPILSEIGRFFALNTSADQMVVLYPDGTAKVIEQDQEECFALMYDDEDDNFPCVPIHISDIAENIIPSGIIELLKKLKRKIGDIYS